jgi:NADP-dependent 3-hydroxy acid dehydrogenase YdfG
LGPDDVAEAIVWVATRPERVVVSDLVLLPLDQASANHVSRKSGPA